MTVGTAFLASLEALAVFLQAPALDAMAASLSPFQAKRGTFPGLPVPAADTAAVLSACFTSPVALAVLGLTEALDASAPELPSRGEFI